MGNTYRIRYRLPVTNVRFTATRTYTRDSVLHDGNKEELTSSAAELIVKADARSSLTAQIETGGLWDVSASLALTDDQRLSSASNASDGKAGAVVTGFLGAAVFAASFAGGVPAALAAGLGIAQAVRIKTFSSRVAIERVFSAIQPDEVKPIDPVEEAYEQGHRVQYQQLSEYRRLLGILRQEALELAIQATQTPAERVAMLRDLRVLKRLQAEIEANIERLNLHFQAWRASTLETWTQDLVEEIPFDDLPATTTGDLDWLRVDEGRLRHIWKRFGLMVVPFPTTEKIHPVEAESQPGVYEREPRSVTWKLWKRSIDSDTHRCIGTGTSLVLDRHSPISYIPFRKSFWAKRTVKATFGSSGSLSGLDVESTSSLAAAAQTLGSLPTTAASSAEQANKLSDQLYSLRSKSLDQAADRAKKLLDLKQSEMTKAGLTATEADYAELERLKQQVAIAENTAKLQPDVLAATSLKGQTDLLTAQRELEAAKRQSKDQLSGLDDILGGIGDPQTDGVGRRRRT